MKIIPYIKKQTNANTQYNCTTSTDTNWVLAQSKRLVDVATDCISHGIKEGMVLDQSNPKLPRMSTGKRNSPKSMCEGVVDNFNHGQYDLSDKQMEGLAEAFRIGNEIINDFEEVEFNEVEHLPKITHPVTEMNNIKNTIFADLFDLSQYEVDSIVLRKK